MRPFALLLLGLTACSGGEGAANRSDAAQDLESAAIERGLIRDPADSEVAGLYARDTDRVCVVRDGLAYRVGAFVDYGEGITCSGSGALARSGGSLRIELGDGACSFTARFDGETIRFPGALPDECKRLCNQRASFAGLDVNRLSDSEAEARAMRDPGGRRLCGR